MKVEFSTRFENILCITDDTLFTKLYMSNYSLVENSYDTYKYQKNGSHNIKF